MKKAIIALLTTACALCFFALTACEEENGKDGKSAYALYKEKYGYTGGEEEWLQDLIGGGLAIKETHEVIFDTVGGSAVATQEIAHGEKVSLPSAPTKDGYLFDGWYVGEEEWSFIGYSVTEDITLTAKWINDPAGSSGLTYRLLEGNSYAQLISIGECTKSVVRIASEYDGVPVKSIGSSAFSGCTGITEVVIPASVEQVEEYAFFGCKNLTAITVDGENVRYSSENGILYDKGKTKIICAPNGICGKLVLSAGVEKIGYGAFWGCVGLTEILLPSTLVTIEESAFAACTGLTKITIPTSVVNVGSFAFSSCTGLTEAELLSGVESIETYAFSDCTSLTEMGIPASVTSIGVAAFSGCTKLSSITVEEDNENYASEGGILYNKNKTEAVCVPSGIGGNFTFCSSVIRIGDFAFARDTGLTGVEIPTGVTSIGECAFVYCTSLTQIVIPATVQSIGDSAFYYCTGLEKVYYSGTQSQWQEISLAEYNEELTSAEVYYYSETQADGCWRYVGGVPTPWA